jgi:hypothetical protein
MGPFTRGDGYERAVFHRKWINHEFPLQIKIIRYINEPAAIRQMRHRKNCMSINRFKEFEETVCRYRAKINLFSKRG